MRPIPCVKAPQGVSTIPILELSMDYADFTHHATRNLRQPRCDLRAFVHSQTRIGTTALLFMPCRLRLLATLHCNRLRIFYTRSMRIYFKKRLIAGCLLICCLNLCRLSFYQDCNFNNRTLGFLFVRIIGTVEIIKCLMNVVHCEICKIGAIFLK